MKRFLGRTAAAVAVLGSVLGGLTACTDEQTGLVIMGNLRTRAPGCVARADDSSEVYLEGVLDVALKLDYRALLLVGNQLTPRGDKQNLRAETQIINVTGAEVSIFRDDGSLERTFTVPATGVISPAEASSPGFGVVGVTLIPQQSGSDLADELMPGVTRTRVIEARVFGATVGGDEVESATFTYVVNVCEGCLVQYPLASLNANGQCLVGEPEGDLPCAPGQDEPLECLFCSTELAVCSGT